MAACLAKRGDSDGEFGSVGAEYDFCTGILLLSTAVFIVAALPIAI